jgi:hypothetical protein
MINRRQALRKMPFFVLLGLLASSNLENRVARATDPSANQIKQILSAYFMQLPDYQPGDLISQRDAKSVIEEMANQGWQVPKSKELLNNVLGQDAPLVGLLSTKDGKRLMRNVSSYKLVYDRMDRVSRVSGGERMLRDLAKLPDGERYVKMQPPAAVPDMLDLLPKQKSGRKRSIKDYSKPTGRVYTEQALATRIHEHFKAKEQSSTAR